MSQGAGLGGATPTHGLRTLCPYQEIKMSVTISAAMKSAKTIQYIIHRTCGVRAQKSAWGWQHQLPTRASLAQRFQGACPAT